MKQKPIIAISLDSQPGALTNSYSEYPWYALREDYAHAVTSSGGVAIMLPFDESSIDNILDIADGLIIPGGDFDIDPKFYGQEISSDNVIINHARTNYDMKLLEKALAKNMPFLGICYGMQLMNVFFGGSLIQDLPKDQQLTHKQPMPKNAPWHDINIESGSKLAQIAGNNLAAKVNSRHHQAVDKVGQNLITSATAPDGVIEAIESTIHKFAIGVEWHPEYQNIELDIALFKAFIDAAKLA
jgi:putative glutamine amidotransferase